MLNSNRRAPAAEHRRRRVLRIDEWGRNYRQGQEAQGGGEAGSDELGVVLPHAVTGAIHVDHETILEVGHDSADGFNQD